MSETNNKIKTSELMIIVNGPADKPYYSIRYYDLSDNEWHIGFSSYELAYVIEWTDKHFKVVEPVEYIESAKSTGTSKVKEFWQKVKQKYESKDGQYIDRVLNDIVEETIKEVECFKEFDICLGEKVIGTAEIKYPEMTLNNFKIYSEYQNKGYGQKAIKQFVNDFGVTNLWVDPQNEVAKHIYEKNGFVVDDTPLFIAMRVKGGATNE